MTTYIIRRLFMAVIILFLVSLIVFFAMRLLPGDPLIIFLGQQAGSGTTVTEKELEVLRHEYGLDKPIMVQYANWVSGIFQGNLGTSIHYHEKVGKLMLERFPITLQLGLTAYVIGNALGILLGVLAAVRRGTWLDTFVTVMGNLGITIFVPWLGLLLMYAFGLKLGWLPIAGFTSPFDNFWLSIKQMGMPCICLAITPLSFIARQTRSSMLEVTKQDYIRTAWSKGLREQTIIMRHALKNGLIPVITLLGLGIGFVFGGSVLVETIFAIPGVGRLLITSVFAQDYVVIQSGTLVISTIIILSNLIVDISYGWLDPRIRYG
jgi:peptide/nickel transport system permease protein